MKKHEKKAGSQPGLPGSTGFRRANSQAGFCLDPDRSHARVGRVPGFKTMHRPTYKYSFSLKSKLKTKSLISLPRRLNSQVPNQNNYNRHLVFHELPLQSSLFSVAVLLLHTALLLLQPDFPTEAARSTKKRRSPPRTWQRIINEFRRILNLYVKIISHRTRRLIPD